MPQRNLALILADIGAISASTPAQVIQSLRDELPPTFQSHGDPRASTLWANQFAAATATTVTRLLVAGWYHEYRGHPEQFSGAAGLASLGFLT